MTTPNDPAAALRDVAETLAEELNDREYIAATIDTALGYTELVEAAQALLSQWDDPGRIAADSSFKVCSAIGRLRLALQRAQEK